jgi:hypothetical protein
MLLKLSYIWEGTGELRSCWGLAFYTIDCIPKRALFNKEDKRKMTDSIVGLVIIPIVGAIIVAILPVDESTDKNRVKSVGRIVSMLTLIESMRL